MINNYDWLSRFTFLEDFLMKVARAFSIKEMVKMETFATRLADETAGLSLLEFLYPVLQAWDFLWLFEKHDCRLQIGGSDQWGNILQGIDLIRRMHSQEAFALTLPLLTTSSGQKMGKSVAGTVWLNPEMTSPFDFFQYLQGVEDTLVPQMLRLLTFLDLAEIDEVIKDPRAAQLRLAFEVTKIVHGEEAAQKAQQDFDRLAGRAEGATESVPVFTLPEGGLELDEILVQAGVLPSKSAVRRRCAGGGIRIDDEKVANPKTQVNTGCVIRFGKGKFLKIELSNAN